MSTEIFYPHSHCHYCGTAFPEGPRMVSRTCLHCTMDNYINPAPVSVLVIPAPGRGVYGVRRGIEPRRGFVALPAGYMNYGEDWRDAAARETFEELQIRIWTPRTSIRHFDTKSTPDGTQVLVFGYVADPASVEVGEFHASEEALGRYIVTEEFPEEIAFPFHKEIIRRYLSQEN